MTSHFYTPLDGSVCPSVCLPLFFLTRVFFHSLSPLEVKKLSLHCRTTCISGIWCLWVLLWGPSLPFCVLLHLLTVFLHERLNEIFVGGGSIRHVPQEQVSNCPRFFFSVLFEKFVLEYDEASTNYITSNMFWIGQFSGWVGPILVLGFG